MSVTFCRTVAEAATGPGPGARGAPGSTTPPWPPRSRRGSLPVETADADRAGDRLGGRPADRHGAPRPRAWPAGASPCATSGPRADVLDAARPHRRRLPAHRPRRARGGDRARAGCPGSPPASRSWSTRSRSALDAIAAGGGRPGGRRLGPRRGGRAARRDRPARRSSSAPPFRPDARSTTPARRSRARCSPPGSGRSTARARRARATPGRPGRDEEPPVPARRLSAEWEDAAWRAGGPEEGLGRLDPDLARILERSLEGTPPRVAEIERLFRARGPEVEAIARVADTLRERALRRHGHLRHQPQHQLHQPVLLPLRLLRLLARAQEPQPARRPLHPERARGGPPLGRGLGARRHRGLPAGRHPPRLHRRLLRLGARGHQGAPARDARPRLHAARGLAGRPHPRHQRARVPHPPARRRPRAPCRARPPRSSTTACAPTCARTRCAPPSGPR